MCISTIGLFFSMASLISKRSLGVVWKMIVALNMMVLKVMQYGAA